jgi:hypothetical protein
MTALPDQSSQSQEKIFTTGGESFMGQDPTVTIDQGVIVRMSPGVIRDIIRQFTDGPVDSVLPLTARGGIPFQILMIHDKTRQVFWMRNGKEPVRPLDKGSDADRNTIARFFEYRSLLPPANLQIQFGSVSKAFPAKADLRNLFLRVRTSDDFTIPDGWTEDDWIKFVVRSRSGDPALKADVDDVQSFDTFLLKTFGATLFQEKDKVRGHAGPPNYEMAGHDLTEWIKFVLNVRSPDWNALYLRQIGLIFYVIDSRLVVFTVDKNTNRISCLSTSTDIIKYNIGNDNARSDDYSSLKVMLKSQMESLLDPRTLDKYSFDPGITPNAQNVSAQNVVCHSLPPFSHRNFRVFLRFLPHLLTTPASHHEASSYQSMFLPHAISWAHFPAHLRCTGSLSEAALPVATNTSAHDTSLEQTPSPSENIERDRGCRHPLGRPAQCCDPGCDPRAPQVHPLGAALQTVHLSGAQRAQVDEEERHEGVH